MFCSEFVTAGRNAATAQAAITCCAFCRAASAANHQARPRICPQTCGCADLQDEDADLSGDESCCVEDRVGVSIVHMPNFSSADIEHCRAVPRATHGCCYSTPTTTSTAASCAWCSSGTAPYGRATASPRSRPATRTTSWRCERGNPSQNPHRDSIPNAELKPVHCSTLDSSLAPTLQ